MKKYFFLIFFFFLKSFITCNISPLTTSSFSEDFPQYPLPRFGGKNKFNDYYIHQFYGAIHIPDIRIIIFSIPVIPNTEDKIAWTDDETYLLLFNIFEVTKLLQKKGGKIEENTLQFYSKVLLLKTDFNFNFHSSRIPLDLIYRHMELLSINSENEFNLGIVWSWKLDCLFYIKMKEVIEELLSIGTTNIDPNELISILLQNPGNHIIFGHISHNTLVSRFIDNLSNGVNELIDHHLKERYQFM